MLRKIASMAVVLTLAVFVGAALQTSLVAVETPSSRIARADEAFLAELHAAMEQSAESLGMALDLSDLTYLGRGDILGVVAGAEGFEDAGGSDPVLRVDVGLIYLSEETTVRFGDGKVGSRLPAGFHAVRAEIDQTRNVHDPGVTILESISGADSEPTDLAATLVPPRSTRDLAIGLAVEASGGNVLRVGWYGMMFGIELELLLPVPRSPEM